MFDNCKVGFISQITQESCSKSARILLTHLTSKHPHLLSGILKQVKENIEQIGALALYLYEELPLTIWKVTEDDLEIISRYEAKGVFIQILNLFLLSGYC